MLQEDRTILSVLHLSQLLTFITAGIGGFLVPLIIWILKKDHVYQMDAQGKEVINFQISMFLLGLIALPLVFLLGLGVIILAVIPFVIGIFSILNGIRANRGEAINYPLTYKFLK